MRKFVLLVLVLGLMALGAGISQAHPTGGRIDTATINSFGKVVEVRGMLTCTNGESYLLRVNLSQSDGDTALGRASGHCTGSPQVWVTGVEETDGSFFCGPAAGHMQIRTQPDGATKLISDRAQVVGCAT